MKIKDRVIKIIQITDLHLFGNKEKFFLGLNPYSNLDKIASLIKKDIEENETDLIVTSGDISQDYSKESYLNFSKILSDLTLNKNKHVENKIKSAVIPGNHDDIILFEKVFTNFKCKKIDFTNWQILFLNSHWPNHIEGMLNKEELIFLDQKLKNNQEKFSFIFLHHHIIPIGVPWLDTIRLNNASEFIDIASKYKNLKAVASGHVHQENNIKLHGINFITTPATSFQFSPFSYDFKLDDKMPGYRKIKLYNDGSIETEVIRIPYDKKALPKLDSIGY